MSKNTPYNQIDKIPHITFIVSTTIIKAHKSKLSPYTQKTKSISRNPQKLLIKSNVIIYS